MEWIFTVIDDDLKQFKAQPAALYYLAYLRYIYSTVVLGSVSQQGHFGDLRANILNLDRREIWCA